MNQQIFDQYAFSRSHLAMILRYDRNLQEDAVTRRSEFFIFVRDLSLYTHIQSLTTIQAVLAVSTAVLTEDEKMIQNSIKDLYSRKGNSTIKWIKNSYVNEETSLFDMKVYLGMTLETFPTQLYIETSQNRKPVQTYVSGIRELPQMIKDVVVSEMEGDEVSIDDLLLKNIAQVHGVYCFTAYNCVDYIDTIRTVRGNLLLGKENEKNVAALLNKYWTKIDKGVFLTRIQTGAFTGDWVEQQEQLLTDYTKLIVQESEYNELFWRVKEKDLFSEIGIYFNSFILENKENKRERTIDLYSLFKFYSLSETVPFSRYSYGNQVSQKMVKIFEMFYRIENIHYLEKWSQMISYRDTPSNCVQWKGFSDGIEYEVIFFSDATYQIRFYQQRVPLDHIETLLEQIRQTILLPVQDMLANLGVIINVVPLELGKNIQFVFSKLEIDVVVKQELEVGKLQNLMNKSHFLFDREGNLISNEFVNVEFKKVNNYTRADQIYKYINYYVTQNRITELSEIGPVIKQISAKYNKDLIQATELVHGWIRRFVDVTNQQNKKIKISKNIGLDIIGKQNGNNRCTFYMSNVVNLDDIKTFYYYLIVLLYCSQSTENNRIYSELIGKKVDDKTLSKVQDKKDEEGEVDVLGDIDFDALDLDGDVAIVDDDILERLSVHSDEKVEEAEQAEVEIPNEDDVFDELKPIVNGSSYYIKRLQMMDKEVYDYKIDEKFTPYSKKAMPNDSRQPVVLSNRQMKKIVDRYKDDTNVYGGIKQGIDVYKDFKAPSYSIAYRNLNYICPKVWCMQDQLPYYTSDLLNVVIGYNDKGEYIKNPDEVRCPDCGGGIWKSGLGEGTLLIAQDNLKRQPYPGFITGNYHPKGHCMVACFKRPNQKVEECLTQQKEVKKEKKVSNEKYILKGDKNGQCMYGRYCILPNTLHEWMNQEFGDFKNERIIADGYIGYLRKGILDDDEFYYQSFERSIQYLLGDSVFLKSSEEFREYLIQLLKDIPDINKIFRKCRKGSLYLYFGKDIQNFYNYLRDTISLQPKFILPILSYPRVLVEKGVNFFILQEENGKIFFDCEYFDYRYDPSRIQADNIFLYRYSIGNSYKKVFYEPIVQVQQKSKTVQLTRTFVGVAKDSLMEELFKYVEKQCLQKEDPLITAAKIGKIGEEEYFIAKPDSQKVIQIIMKVSDFQIINQYVNLYNQTEGFIVSSKMDEKQYYVPIVPMEILEDLPIIKQKTSIVLHRFNETFAFLDDFSKKTGLPYTPYFYTLHHDGELRTGIYTVSGEWIPVIYEPKDSSSNESLKEWSIPKDIWVQEPMQGDQRTEYQKERDTKSMNYEKLRFELSKWVNTNDGLKEMILGKMRAYKDRPDMEGKEEVRMQFITELSTFLRNQMVTPGLIGDWNKSDLFHYCSNHTEIAQCNTGSMCRWSGDCKMIVQPEWYWNFVSRMVEELLMNVNKRKEIVEEYRKELELPQNQRIFYSKEEMDDFIQRYDFNVENKKFMYHPLEHFDYTNPKPIIMEQEVERMETYKLPNYIKRLFEVNSSNSRNLIGDTLGVFGSTDQTSQSFFRSLDEIRNKIKQIVSKTRDTLSRIILKYPNPTDLLDRYESLSEQEDGERYRKFLAMKSIEALAEYVKTNSWGSEIDLELMGAFLSKDNVRFIILNDVGHIDRKEPFIYLSNHLNGMNAEQIHIYRFAIFCKHKTQFNLIIKKDTKNPLFLSNELPFLARWLQGQAEYEQEL